tara:strand:+ start:6831 stop:7181 length:351 start_codon:yes stop_codon:yes gene_type:complete
MTIYQGSQGSLNLFWNDLFISSFPLSKKKKLSLYEYEGTHLITEALKDNVPFNTIHEILSLFCKGMYNRKVNKLPIYKTDHELFMCSIFGLIKLKKIDFDDNVLIMCRKKPKKITS